MKQILLLSDLIKSLDNKEISEKEVIGSSVYDESGHAVVITDCKDGKIEHIGGNYE